MNPQFPIYIPSKGRFETCLTMRYLDSMRVPYRVIVEEQEHDAYADALGADKLLVLDQDYKRRYETLDPEGDAKGVSKGSGPARNFIWDHAVSVGAPWHWVMDDNIRGFYRLNRKKKIHAGDGTIFRCMEDFVQRYKNVAQAGPQYAMFAPAKRLWTPITLNTRIFSCILIRSDIPFRWRGRYNEDVELSLRILKAKWCTIEFWAFLQEKQSTQTMRGGNTDAFYASEGTLPKSQLIVRAHPDVAVLTRKYGRWHHHINYRKHFLANKLVRRTDIEIPEGIDEYGMRLEPYCAPTKRVTNATP